MNREVTAQVNDPSTAARYLGESVGTHYSAALRAADAYGRHLAARREALMTEKFEGQGLADFWKELLDSEQVPVGSVDVMEGLSTTPSFYFFDFLDTADAAFDRRYPGSSPNSRKGVAKAEHARCLGVLRDHAAQDLRDHFAVRNKIATWMRMLRMMGGYRE